MKFKEKYNINSDFEDLFSFNSKEEELEHEAKMIMFRFLSELEKLNGKPIKKKELAKAIETSPSFITQLYQGDKIIKELSEKRKSPAENCRAFLLAFMIGRKKSAQQKTEPCRLRLKAVRRGIEPLFSP